jgi:hypothetical protein
VTSYATSGTKLPTVCVSPDLILRLVVAEFRRATTTCELNEGGKRYGWPSDDRFSAHVSGLPVDCTIIEFAIREYMEFVDGDGFVRFPVCKIEIDRPNGRICIVGDRGRISEMRPL